MSGPMTTEDFFNKIHGILKEKGMLPDILDYGLSSCDPVQIRTCEFNLRSSLDYGSSEGIYLDFWIEYYMDGTKRTGRIGTFKTLREDNEAMHIMAGLLADFIIEGHACMDADPDSFIWEGANVCPVDDDTGKPFSWGYFCRSMEAAIKKKEELLKKYSKVVVRDNATRNETIYTH